MSSDSLHDIKADARPQRGIQSLDITGELLAALVANARPLALRDLAAAANMPAAKAFPHLVSLLKTGLLTRDAAGLFAAGPLAFELGLIGLQRLSPTREAEAEIVELATHTNMSVAMAVLGPLGPTIVRLEEAAQPVHVSLRVGTVMSLVNTAIGRVFAAHLADDVLARLLAQDGLRLAGAPDTSETTHATVDAKRLAQIRAQGMDTAFGRPIPGIDTLAAPVFDHTGSICLVIALMGTVGSFERDLEGAPARVLDATVKRLSYRFGWSGAAAD